MVEEQRSCRQLPQRLNETQTPPPSGKKPVWHVASVRNMLSNRVYAGPARYNYRQPGLPKYRKVEDTHLQYLKTGRSYRPPQEWVWSEAPASISPELFEKAQLQLQRNAEAARKLSQPSSRRYLLRPLVKGGECGLGCACLCQGGKNSQAPYLYYEGKGRQPLTGGRVTKCRSHLVRADRLDAVVWASLCQLLRTPSVIPTLHQSWAQAKQHNLTARTAQQTQVLQRRQRVERQSQRLLDAYQAEAIPLSELPVRRHKLTNAIQHLDLELQQLTQTQQQATHWHQILDHAERFRQLWGENLERLSFAERQIVAQCLIKQVVVTGEQVDIYYVLPFDSAPQVYNSSSQHPEGTPGHFYRLRLVDLDRPPDGIDLEDGFGHPHRARDIGDKEVPGQQCQMGLRRSIAFFLRVFPGSSPAVIDDRLWPTRGHQTRGHPLGGPEEARFLNEMTLGGLEDPEQINRGQRADTRLKEARLVSAAAEKIGLGSRNTGQGL